MNFLKKLQSLPEQKRKFILWSIVIVIVLISLIFWIKNIQKILRNFPREEVKEQFQYPFQEKLKEMPKIEIPEIEVPKISEEEWKKMKEGLSEEEIKIFEEALKLKEIQK